MKTALILPGGAAKGAMQIGACKIILDIIKPDIIIGTSVGSLNGAMIADGKNTGENMKRLEELWLNFKSREVFPISKDFFFKFYSEGSIYSNNGLYKLIQHNLRAKKFSELIIPLYVNCTNLATGKSEFFSNGDLIHPLVASCSPAPILPPVEIKENKYIDGAMGSVLGIEKAIELKCTNAIVVNIEYHEDFSLKKGGVKEYAEHVLAISRQQSIRNELRILKDNMKVIEISPNSPIYELMPTTVKNVKNLIKLGEDEARRVLG